MTPALPFLRWLPQWRQKDVLRADLLAGLTGAIVVLPRSGFVGRTWRRASLMARSALGAASLQRRTTPS